MVVDGTGARHWLKTMHDQVDLVSLVETAVAHAAAVVRRSGNNVAHDCSCSSIQKIDSKMSNQNIMNTVLSRIEPPIRLNRKE
jgi:hypothetical protein